MLRCFVLGWILIYRNWSVTEFDECICSFSVTHHPRPYIYALRAQEDFPLVVVFSVNFVVWIIKEIDLNFSKINSSWQVCAAFRLNHETLQRDLSGCNSKLVEHRKFKMLVVWLCIAEGCSQVQFRYNKSKWQIFVKKRLRIKSNFVVAVFS